MKIWNLESKGWKIYVIGIQKNTKLKTIGIKICGH